MIKLFRYEGFKVIVSEEALTLKPFKIIWNRDRRVQKDVALQELGYIYFLCDPRSDYQYIIDLSERSEAIKEGLGLDKKWKPDKVVQEGINLYNSFKTPSALLLEDTIVAVDKLRKFLRDIDLEALDDRGKPMYSISSITSTIKMIPVLVRDLKEAENVLKKEELDNSRIRGSKEKSLMDDSMEF